VGDEDFEITLSYCWNSFVVLSSREWERNTEEGRKGDKSTNG
jgi:hypothetical protein